MINHNPLTALVAASAIALSAALNASAATSANIEFAPAEQLPVDASHPVLSPDGSMLLITSPDFSGLSIFDMSTAFLSEIESGVGVGFGAMFTSDSKAVVFQRVTPGDDGLMMHEVCRKELVSGLVTSLSAPSRRAPALASKAAGGSYAMSSDRCIEISLDGTVKALAPLGDDHSYLWPSISPDGSKILFNEPFEGVFVCSIDGSNLKKIAQRGDYPCWLSDNVVAMVVSHDDGYAVLSSDVVIVDTTDNQCKFLSPEGVIVEQISASSLTKTLVYSTVDGKIFKQTYK